MKWRIASIVLAVLLVGGAVFGGITVTNLTSQLNELEASYASLETEYTSLQSDYSLLQSHFEALQDKNRQLSDDNARLEREITSANQKIDELKKLAPPFDYYPQHRSEYTVGEYIPKPGIYRLTETYVLIGFPDVEDDLVLSRGVGTSMQPFIGQGAWLIGTKRFSRADIAVGDLVSWKDHIRGESITHQVIKVLPDGVVTKGFNNLEDDGLIPWAWIETLWIGVIF